MPDGGLQQERTALAWWRTSLSLAAGIAGLLRLTSPASLSSISATTGLAIVGLVLLALARRRAHELRRAEACGAPSPGLVRAVSLAAAAAGLLALLLLHADLVHVFRQVP